MAPKTFHTRETLEGNGKVFRSGRQISEVVYTIFVKQELIGDDAIPGQKVITGRLIVTEGERNLVTGTMLTLHLKDGRKAEFWAMAGGAPPGSLKIYVTEITD